MIDDANLSPAYRGRVRLLTWYYRTKRALGPWYEAHDMRQRGTLVIEKRVKYLGLVAKAVYVSLIHASFLASISQTIGYDVSRLRQPGNLAIAALIDLIAVVTVVILTGGPIKTRRVILPNADDNMKSVLLSHMVREWPHKKKVLDQVGVEMVHQFVSEPSTAKKGISK